MSDMERLPQEEALMTVQGDMETADQESSENAMMIGSMIREVMAPVIDAFGAMIRNINEANERQAAALQQMSAEMAELKKQVRLNTLVTPAQVRHLNDAIKSHARELLAPRQLQDDAKAVRELSAAIRKNLLSTYGVDRVYEVPKVEYNVAMNLIARWNNVLTLMDIAREARKRNEVQEKN